MFGRGSRGGEKREPGAAGSPDDDYRGVARYRRRFEAPADMRGPALFSAFDAANTSADVYWNGVLLGSHSGGFSAFRYDATEAVLAGENVLALKVDHAPSPDVAPLRADFTFLRRAGSADASARVRVTNSGAEPRAAEVVLSLLDDSGASVATFVTRASVPAGETLELPVSGSIERPRLWQGRSDPHLDDARVELSRAGTPVDSLTQPLGVRSFAIDRPRQPAPTALFRHRDGRRQGLLEPRQRDADGNGAPRGEPQPVSEHRVRWTAAPLEPGDNRIEVVARAAHRARATASSGRAVDLIAVSVQRAQLAR